ncbi:MAG: ATP-dependent DNA helicase, partial [Chlamydiae bacterium]|nr:ATP-dependent DNA helicase [Chlamydiota bacterium]
QQKAVQATEGRVLILAGAGSGKTSVLTYRMAHLIQNRSIDPSNILGLTFTNKAAGEMKERLAKIIPPRHAKKVTLCTFHSFCMQILRKEIHHLGYTSEFSLYDEKDVKRLLTQMVKHALEHEGEIPSIQPTLKKISDAKNKGLTEDEIISEVPTWHDEFSNQIMKQLHTCMRAYNAVDFDSLLSLTVELFEKHPDVLKIYQEKFKYIMIDEYQDTNPIQYKLAHLLSLKHNNLCVVGDDDQSIYGWRGAEIKNILNFPADITIKLEQNYRSTPFILKAANHVIANNKERHRKELWSQSDAGDPIRVFHAPTETEEVQAVIQRIIWYRKHKKLRWKDMAILYRSNLLSRNFETALSQAVWDDNGSWRRGIPYAVFGGTEFYERAEIKDVLSYLRVISNPNDQEALLRIINVPRRGISDKTLDILTQYNRTHNKQLFEVLQETASRKISFSDDISDKAIQSIQNFLNIVSSAKEKFSTGPLHETFDWLIQKIDYKKAIIDDVKSEKMRQFKWENVLQCVTSLKEYESSTEGEQSLADFVSASILDQEKSPLKDKEDKEDKVSLMTIHSSKGLEFTTCFLVGCEDHIIPHEKSVFERGLEEERRLMYVAMTRAKKHLILSMARKRKKMGKDISTTPSRFLFEVPKEVLQMSQWQSSE